MNGSKRFRYYSIHQRSLIPFNYKHPRHPKKHPKEKKGVFPSGPSNRPKTGQTWLENGYPKPTRKKPEKNPKKDTLIYSILLNEILKSLKNKGL